MSDSITELAALTAEVAKLREELAKANAKPPTDIKRAAFDKMTAHDKRGYIIGGGRVHD